MKFKFKVLLNENKKLEEADVPSTNREHDYIQFIYTMIVYNKSGSNDYEQFYTDFLKGVNNKPFFKDSKIKKQLIAQAESQISKIGDFSDFKKEGEIATKAIQISKDIFKFSSIYFLTAYTDEIKDVKNIDKIIFMYGCDVRGKIKKNTITSSKYQYQVFENEYNYLMDDQSFDYVFSAYTLAFNANDKPERYLAKVGSRQVFVTKSEAEKIYNKEKDHGETKRSNQDVIEYLFNKFLKVSDKNVEYTTRSGDTFTLSSKLPFKSKRAIIGNEIFKSAKGFNFEDADEVTLTWKDEWAKRNFRAAGWKTFMDVLSKDKTYRQYYFGVQ